MKLYIPEIGDTFKLSNDWTFNCIQEYRNQEFLKNNNLVAGNVTLSKDSILKVARIYIRKGNKDFSSVTFFVKGTYNGRFFARLEDVNKMEIEETSIDINEGPQLWYQCNFLGGRYYSGYRTFIKLNMGSLMGHVCVGGLTGSTPYKKLAEITVSSFQEVKTVKSYGGFLGFGKKYQEEYTYNSPRFTAKDIISGDIIADDVKEDTLKRKVLKYYNK